MSVDRDPFAPVEDPWKRPKAVPSPELRKETPEPEAEFTGEVGLSAKFGPGYEAPMFHVKAKDVYTLGALVGYEGDEEVSTRKFFAGLVRYWTDVSRIVQNDYKGSRSDPQEDRGEPKPAEGARPTRSSGSRPTERSRPQERRTDDDASTDWMYDLEVPPECKHGEWRPVTKIGSKGRWFAWGCPGSKDDQCNNGLDFVNKK